jgi:hypothetical protein
MAGGGHDPAGSASDATLAREERRTRRVIARSHPELVGALQGDKGTLSQSLRTLAARGLLGIMRARGGQAAALYLTSEGPKGARPLAGSCAEGIGAGARGPGCLDRLPLLRGRANLQDPSFQGRRPRKKEVACQLVQSTRRHNEQREAQCP